MPVVNNKVTPNGAFIDLLVAVSLPRQTALQNAGQAVPAPVPARALIDTGASCTAIDPSLIQALGLTPTGTVPVHTPTTGQSPQICNQFDIALALIVQPNIHIMVGRFQ